MDWSMNTVSFAIYIKILINHFIVFFLENLLQGIHHLKQLVAMKCSSSQENQNEINERIEQVVADAIREYFLKCKLSKLKLMKN